MARIDGRTSNQLRPVSISTNAQPYAEGSVLITMGETRVLCSVSVEDKQPPFLRGTTKGWVTAEYSMLPRATLTRTPRDRDGHVNGRTVEIQRLIGRSLRAVTDMEALGPRTLTVDCDVLQADGGTRTAAITGAYVALYQAMNGLVRKSLLKAVPMKSAVAAVSVGIIEGQILLDLCYQEDSKADVDFNIVKVGTGEFVELQGTAEAVPFPRKSLDDLLAVAQSGIDQLLRFQQEAIKTL